MTTDHLEYEHRLAMVASSMLGASHVVTSDASDARKAEAWDRYVARLRDLEESRT